MAPQQTGGKHMGLVLAEITMDVEDTFAVEWPDSAAYQSQTVGELRRLLLEQLATSGRLIRLCGGNESQVDPTGKNRWTARQVWEALRGIIHRTGDVPFERITPDANLREDLGLD
jgi:acyl carrier protein